MWSLLRSSSVSFAAVVAGLLLVGRDGLAQATSKRAIGDQLALPLRTAFGQPVEFATSTGVTVRIEIAANPYSVQTFSLMPDDTGSMWFDYGDGPTSKHARVTGAVEQLGYVPCAAIVEWTRNGDDWRGTVTPTDDRAAITRACLSIDAGEIRWAKRLRTDGLLQFPDPSEAERIAGFVRLWSEVKYNFAFFDRLPHLDWERVLVDGIPRVQRATSVSDYYRELQRCMALLQDGHTDVHGPADWPTAAPPIAIREIEGRIVVTAVGDAAKIVDEELRSEFSSAALQVGDELVAIDGQPVASVLQEKVHPFVFASTPQHRSLLACPWLLRGPAGSRVRLTVRTGAAPPRDVSLTRGYLRARLRTVTRPDGAIGDDFVYIALPSFGSDAAALAFERMLPAIRTAKGLILDVRQNGGGSTAVGNRILSWLTDKPLPGSHWRTREYRPAFRAWGRAEGWHRGKHEDVVPQSEPWLGPVVVLTGPATFSAAEDFLVVLKASGRARLVGEATAGSTGQPLVVDGLPAGGRARICTKRDTFPDGTEFVGVGVLPDVPVQPSIADLVAGRDTVFERGLAELRAMLGK
jgi:carboxyl-terminal processing protease